MSSQRPKKARSRKEGESSGSSSRQSRPSEACSSSQLELPSHSAMLDFSAAEKNDWDLMDKPEKKRKVEAMMRYMICSTAQNVPVKKDELSKAVMDGHGKSFNIVLHKANQRLQKVFGLRIVDGKKGTQQVYMLVNTLPADVTEAVITRTENELSSYGLLATILCFLMMKPQGIATDEQILNLLNRLGLNEETLPFHEVFSAYKDIFMPFLEQGYLEREKKVIADHSVFEYRWGPRAWAEVDRKKLLMMMAELHGDDYRLWERQFGDLIKDPKDHHEN